MDPTIIVSLVTLAGTAMTTFVGIFASAKLTAYRIQQLEDKVNKHNNIIERTFCLETKQEDLADRLEKLEGFIVYADKDDK